MKLLDGPLFQILAAFHLKATKASAAAESKSKCKDTAPLVEEVIVWYCKANLELEDRVQSTTKRTAVW